jgi:tetratricopeptide (TPR) repeat protein
MVALGTALELKGTFLSLPALVDRSLELLRRATALRPTLAEAHIRLGVTLTAVGRTEEGIAALQEGLRLAPDNAGGHANLARAFWIGQARIDDAIRHFRKALLLNPEGGYAYLQLALLHALGGDFAAAEETARQAVALQEKAMSGTQGLLVVGAHARLGYVHYLKGDYDEAVREYRRELEYLSLSDHALRERTMIEVQQKLAAAYYRAGRREEADQFFAAATRAFDQRLAAGADDPFTRYYVAALYAQREDVEPALQHLAAPLRNLGPFTRWRLPRDPDFAPILANPLLQAALAGTAGAIETGG